MITKTISKTVTLKDGRKVTVEITADFVKEVNYGADADGNRGVTAYFLDDYGFEIVKKYCDNGTELTKENIREVEDLVEKSINMIDLGLE